MILTVMVQTMAIHVQQLHLHDPVFAIAAQVSV